MCKHRKGSYYEGRWKEVDMYICTPWIRNGTHWGGILCRQSSLWEERSVSALLPSITCLISQGKNPLGLILLFHLTLAPQLHWAALLYSLGRCLGSLELIFLVFMWQKGTFPCFIPFYPTGDNKGISTGMKLMVNLSNWKQLHRPSWTISVLKCFPLHKVLTRTCWEILVS